MVKVLLQFGLNTSQIYEIFTKLYDNRVSKIMCNSLIENFRVICQYIYLHMCLLLKRLQYDVEKVPMSRFVIVST